MTDPRVESLLVQTRDLCRRVAPIDLADVPLYILPTSQLSDKLGDVRGCFGFTQGTLDLLLKEEIGAAWQGRGPCIVINDEMILERFGGEHLEEDLHGIALHELAHVLVRDQLFSEWENPDREQIQIRTKWVATSVATENVPALPWDRHELPFMRICLHLTWRAEQLGQKVMTAALCAGPIYGLSSALTYQDLLGDEPERFADKSFHDIRHSGFSSEFFNLYIADLQRWYRDHDSYQIGNHQ